MVSTSVSEVLLAGPIYSGVDVVPFAQRKIVQFFPVDGVLILCHFEESKLRTVQIYFIAHKKFLTSAGIEPGSLLETIYETNALLLS